MFNLTNSRRQALTPKSGDELETEKVHSLPFLKIPNGYDPADEGRRDLWRDRDSELTEEELRAFFTREVIETRLIACAQMNRDETDDWGIYGYEPGFIFIQKGEVFQRQPQTINEKEWASGRTLTLHETRGGYNVPTMGHKDLFPRSAGELMVQEIRESNTPKTYKFLCTLLTGSEIHPTDIKLLSSEKEGEQNV